jgi:hypothetical protein
MLTNLKCQQNFHGDMLVILIAEDNPVNKISHRILKSGYKHVGLMESNRGKKQKSGHHLIRVQMTTNGLEASGSIDPV